MRATASLFAGTVLDRLRSPARCYHLAGRLVPWCAGAAVALTLAALALALLAGGDSERGETSRIVFVHVPAAWTSLLVYFGMAAWAALALASQARVAALMMAALAPAGTLFTGLALWTGWLLGKPSWHAGWLWDAQLGCELILFMLYAAVLALRFALGESRRADRASAVLVLVGALNLPFIYFSLSWWNGLHEGAAAAGAPAMARTMLGGMLVLALAFCMYAQTVALARVRFLVLQRTAGRRYLVREGAA